MANDKKSRLRRRLASLVGFSLFCALTACNSGGGDGGTTAPVDTTGNPANGSSNSSVALYDYWLNGSQLRSLPRDDFSAAPSNIVTFTDKPSSWLYTQSTGAGTSLSLDSRNSVLLYTANNRFYRLATAGATRPQPVQVSSESAANSMCDFHDPVRYTPNNDVATLKYRMPGKDLRCLTADDEYREIRLGMAATEVPISVSVDRFRADEVYSAAGQLSGYLVAAKTGNIYWRDAGFANPRQIVATGSVDDWSSEFQLLGQSPDGRYRLLALFTNGIYVFDTTTQNMTLFTRQLRVVSCGVLDPRIAKV